MTFIKGAAKAFVGAAIAAAGALGLVVTGNETFHDVTTAEWIAVVVGVLAVFGGVYRTKNV